MDITHVNSFDDYHQAIQHCTRTGGKVCVFRGVKDMRFNLVPRVGWVTFRSADNDDREERRLIRLFKERAFPYLHSQPTSEWEWLALAQHYGVPTRLLDWTENALVAAYFAVAPETDNHSAVYVYKNRKYVNTNTDKDPFAFKQVRRFVPTHVTTRITAQAGLFTIHPQPKEPLLDGVLLKIVIDVSARKKIKDVLQGYGIHHASLFPDLVGVANYVRRVVCSEY